MLVEPFNWKRLSAIATLATTACGRRVRLYLQLVPGSVKTPAVLAHLQALRRHLNGRRLILVWDRLPVHRSGAIWKYIHSQSHWLHAEYLPPYAPEKNPVEYFWEHVSGTDLANFCADHLGQVRGQVHRAARRVRRRRDLGRAFLKHSGLF